MPQSIYMHHGIIKNPYTHIFQRIYCSKTTEMHCKVAIFTQRFLNHHARNKRCFMVPWAGPGHTVLQKCDEPLSSTKFIAKFYTTNVACNVATCTTCCNMLYFLHKNGWPFCKRLKIRLEHAELLGAKENRPMACPRSKRLTCRPSMCSRQN